MFNDERINAECGKIYRRGILLAVIITLIYATSRSVTLALQGLLHSVVTYTEAVILILGAGILIVGTLRFCKDRDERTLYDQHMFYKKAAVIYVIAVLGTYILTIPFTSDKMLGGQTHNHLLILLEIVEFLYLIYSFKSKDININYSFIADGGWRYYRRVLLNIGTLCLGLLPPFVIAAVWELVLHSSFAGALVILFAYLGSAIGLSVEYLFISLVEKESYDSMDGEGFARGTRISMIVCLTFEFLLSVMQCAYVFFVTGNIRDIPYIKDVGTVIAVISRQRLQIELLLLVLTGLTVCHVMSQIKRGGLLYNVCRIEILLLALAALESTLSPIWYRIFSEEAIRFFVNYIDSWIKLASFVISITVWVAFVHSLRRELGISRILWMIPILKVVVEGINIFLVTQNMLRVGTFSVHIIEMACLILLTVILWRYRGFANKDSNAL